MKAFWHKGKLPARLRKGRGGGGIEGRIEIEDKQDDDGRKQQLRKRRQPRRPKTIFQWLLFVGILLILVWSTTMSHHFLVENENDISSTSTTTTSTKEEETQLMESSLSSSSTNINHAPNQVLQSNLSSSLSSSSSSSSSPKLSTNSFSICLLTKDDNDILPEWLAYHYHTMKLRHLIVALDPNSITSPKSILQRFQFELSSTSNSSFNSNSSSQFTFEIWNDQDYMPKWFVSKYSSSFSKSKSQLHSQKEELFEEYKVPKFVPIQWSQHVSISPFHIGLSNSTSQQQLQQDYMKINNHWYRQRVFIKHCIHQLWLQQNQQQQNQHNTNHHGHHTFVAHIDTDEYIVINPWLRARTKNRTKTAAHEEKGKSSQQLKQQQQQQRRPPLRDIVPIRATPSSIFDLYTYLINYESKRLTPICQSIPTILFGSKEQQQEQHATTRTRTTGSTSSSSLSLSLTSQYQLQYKHWETIRWKYHALWNDYRNGFQKVIMDVSLLSFTDRILQEGSYAYNPHQPSNESCRFMTLFPSISSVRQYPLTLNHYVGSFERYSSRGSDKRRTRQVYDLKANLSDIHDNDGWIDTWLESFIETHGLSKVKRILGEQYFL